MALKVIKSKLQLNAKSLLLKASESRYLQAGIVFLVSPACGDYDLAGFLLRHDHHVLHLRLSDLAIVFPSALTVGGERNALLSGCRSGSALRIAILTLLLLSRQQ